MRCLLRCHLRNILVLLLLLLILLLLVTCLLLHHLHILNILCNMHMSEAEAGVRDDGTEPLLAVRVLHQLVLLHVIIIAILLSILLSSDDDSVAIILLILRLLLLLTLLVLHHVVHSDWLAHFVHGFCVLLLVQ